MLAAQPCAALATAMAGLLQFLLLLAALPTSAAERGEKLCDAHADCHSCAGAASILGQHCGWCASSSKCEFTTSACAGGHQVKVPAACPKPANGSGWHPPAPAPPVATCKWEMTDCRAGTKMNASNCQPILSSVWMMGMVDPHGTWINQTQGAAVCSCPASRNGTDCAIVLPPRPGASKASVCGKKPKQRIRREHDGGQPPGLANNTPHVQVWDGSFINHNLEAPKNVECFMTGRVPFSLNDHRVNLTILPTGGKTGGSFDLHFKMLQRRRGDHLNAESEALLKEMAACIEFTNAYLTKLDKIPVRSGQSNCYFPRHAEIDCVSTGCVAEYQPDTSNPAKTAARYACAQSSCTAWPGLELIAKGVLESIKQLKFVFQDIDPATGSATLLFVAPQLTLEMSCHTGQCIPSNQTAPPPKLPPPVSHKWVYLGCIALVSLVLVAPTALVVSGIRAQRRPATQLDAEAKGGGSATSPRVTVVFEGVCYDVPAKAPPPSSSGGQLPQAIPGGGGTRRVLHEVTGLVKPGELCALMGPSGAGKSSLLDIIAGQPKQGTPAGQVRYIANARRVPQLEVRRLCRYVMQDDRLMPTETVTEALRFAAEMALPRSVSSTEVSDKVEAVIGMLELQKVRDSRVGGDGFAGGLSGGERRRVAVGVELIADPAVLLLDEPTSGLDAVSADVVMRALRRVVDSTQMTCLLTIHQPSAEVYAMFDTVCLIGPGGGHAFFGTRQHGAEAVAEAALHLQPAHSRGGEPVLQLNPAEELLRYSASGPAAVAAFASSAGRQVLVHATAAALDATEVVARPAFQQNGTLQAVSAAAPGPLKLERPPGIFAQFWGLSLRGSRQVVRDPNLMFLQVGVTAFVGLATGLLFLHPGLDLNGVHNRTGLLFFVVVYFALISMSSIGTIVKDKDVYLRERTAELYSTAPYFASKILCDLLPLRIFPPCIFGAIVYPLCGLHDGLFSWRCLIFMAATLLLNATAAAMCFLVAAVSNSVGTANLSASLFFIYNIVFGGLLLTARNEAVTVLMQFSFFFHAYEILMVNEFHGYIELEFNPSHSSLGTKAALISGDTWLVNVGMDVFSNPYLLAQDVAILGFCCLTFYVAGYACFAVQRYKR